MNNEVTVVMASFPPRKEGMLAVVNTLLPQCDRMCLYLNGYNKRPKELPDDPKLEIVLAGPNSAAPDKGSQGKHHWLDKYPDGYYLTVDDDIHYPADYVKKMVAAIEGYGRSAIVTVHGIRYKLDEDGRIPPKGLARAHRTLLHYEKEYLDDTPVHGCGNGCSGFCPAAIGMTTEVTRGPLHSGDDEDVAIFAQRRAIPIVRMKTEAKWLRANETTAEILPQFKDPIRLALQSAKIRSWPNTWELFPAKRAPNPVLSPLRKKPLLTVSMSTYKTSPEMLLRAVNSVLGQSEARLRLIVVNDGGPGSCWNVLKGINDPRLQRVDMEKNSGTYACHSKTLEMCDTPWWSPCDSDDYVLPDHYATMLDLTDDEDNVLLCGWTDVKLTGERTEHRPYSYAKTGGVNKNFRWVSLWAGGLWRASWVRRAGGINGNFRVAYDSALQSLALVFTGVQTVQNVGYIRTLHPGSLTQHPSTGYGSPYRMAVTKELDGLLGKALLAPTLEEAARIMTNGTNSKTEQRTCPEKRNVAKFRHENSCKPYLPKLRSGVARPARIPQRPR